MFTRRSVLICLSLGAIFLYLGYHLTLTSQPLSGALRLCQPPFLMRCGNFLPRSDTSLTAPSASGFDPDNFTAPMSAHNISLHQRGSRRVSAECTR